MSTVVNWQPGGHVYVHLSAAGERYHVARIGGTMTSCHLALTAGNFAIEPLTDSFGRSLIRAKFVCRRCASHWLPLHQLVAGLPLP